VRLSPIPMVSRLVVPKYRLEVEAERCSEKDLKKCEWFLKYNFQEVHNTTHGRIAVEEKGRSRNNLKERQTKKSQKYIF
jgi:hypothetical protein